MTAHETPIEPLTERLYRGRGAAGVRPTPEDDQEATSLVSPEILWSEYARSASVCRTDRGRAGDPDPYFRITPVSNRQTELDQLAEQFPVGSRFGKYLITGMLGRGTSAVVVRAVHQTLNIPVAIKFVRPTARENNPHLYEEFQRESQLLARLNHPHLVRVWDFEDHPEHPYIVLEYVDGLNLMELLDQAGRIAPERAVEVIAQTARGLAAAWEMGVIHRDVKPGNILLNRAGVAKLADLGLASIAAVPHLTCSLGAAAKQAELVGTAAYMPPEQSLSPASVDHRADIYALGATFYQAVTESLPFPARNTREAILKHVTDDLVPPHELVPELPEELSDVILTMMAKNPDERYQTAEELLDDLKVLAEILASSAVPVAANSESPPSRPVAVPVPSSPPLTETHAGGETTPVNPRRYDREPDFEQVIDQAIAAGRSGQIGRAIRELRVVTQRHPLNDRAWLWLAHFCGSTEEAIGYLERLLEYRPDHSRALASIAQYRLRAGIEAVNAGRTQAARSHLLCLVGQDEQNELAWLWLARATDDPDEALDFYQRVLQINPNNRQARAEMESLAR